MYCPVCRHKETKVTDSRVAADGASIRRRRECIKCSFRFSTYEELEILDLAVIKRDGRREAYSREKLIHGLKEALGKRPFTEDNFKKLVHNIERDLQRSKNTEIKSLQIGEFVMKHLKKFDKIGYIRFASVYRAFEDVETFRRELGKLTKSKKKK